MSLATITALLDDKIRTTMLGRELADPRTLERAIEQAVLAYSLAKPLHDSDDLAGVTGGVIALPTDWDAQFSTLLAVEYPIGVVPMATLEAAVARDETGTWHVLLAQDSLTDATVRVHFTRPHVLTNAACTIPAAHCNAVACWAAAEMCRQLATAKGAERDSTMAAAVTSGQSMSGDLARRARDWMIQYRAELGLADPETSPAALPAGTVVAFDRSRQRARFTSL